MSLLIQLPMQLPLCDCCHLFLCLILPVCIHTAYSNAEKDCIEAEVGLFVKTCGRQIEQLKDSVLAAQRGVDAHQRPLLSGHAVAHLHGVVRGQDLWSKGHCKTRVVVDQLCCTSLEKGRYGRREAER